MSDLRLSSSSSGPGRGIKTLAIASLMLSAASAGLSLVVLLVSVGLLHFGAASPDFQRQARAYILDNPEIVIESLKRMEALQKAAEADKLTAVLSERHDEIFSDPTAPVGGNPTGDVTLVEFFDYNCPYCRKAAPMLDAALQADQGLRLAFKEFPILGPGSTFAARAALAAQKQGKYVAFHKAMMAYSGAITESSALQVAADVGLDVEQLKMDMQDPAIDQTIQRNNALAQALRLSGTPSFIIGKEIVRGLVDLDTIKQLIAAARRK